MLYRLSGLFVFFLLSQFELAAHSADSLFSLEARSLGQGVNSEYPESHPLLSANGEQLFFARTSHPQNIGMENRADVWVSHRNEDGSWGRAINLGRPVNDSGENYPVGVTNNGRTLFLYSREAGKTGVVYRSDLNGRIWSRPRLLSINGMQDIGEILHFQVSLDGQYAFLTAAKDEGEADIFVSQKLAEQRWSKPFSLGEQINTDQHEARAFLAPDGQSLFFIRRINGKEEWFFSRRTGPEKKWDQWSPPVRVGEFLPDLPPGNLTLSIDGRRCVFEKSQAAGERDLYLAELPEMIRPKAMMVVSGYILDSDTGLPLTVELDIKTEGEPYSPGKTPVFYGKYQLLFDPGAPFYISPKSGGYLALGNYVIDLEDTEVGEEIDKDFPLTTGSMPKNAKPDLYRLASLNDQLKKLEMKFRETEGNEDSLSVIPAPVRVDDKKLLSRGKSRDEEYRALQEKYFSLFEEDGHIWAQENSGETASGLRGMKERYKQYLDEQEGVSPAVSSTAEDVEEVARMKRKFRRYSDRQKGGQPEPEISVPPLENPPLAPSGAPGFQELEKQVRSELILEQQPVIIYQLKEEVLPGIKEEVAGQLAEKLNLPPEKWEQLEKRVSELYTRKIQEAYSFGQSGKELPAGLMNEDMADLRMELYNLLTDEVRQDIRESLAPVVREELRRQLEKELRKEIEAQLKEELTQLLRTEMLNESGETVFRKGSGSEKAPAGFRGMEAGKFYRQDLELTPIRVGMTLPMEFVHFEANQAILKPYAIEQLDQMVALLQDYPELIVEVEGHTNSLCSKLFGSVLSELRAAVVADYLSDKGIAPERVSYKGYGNSRPLVAGNYPEAHQKNQRVDLKITGVKSAK